MAVSKKDLQCTIGKNIRDARKTCGYTKEVLAEKAEISVEHITQVERGDKMMSVPSLVRMAEALHVSVDTLSTIQKFICDNFKDDDVVLFQRVIVEGKSHKDAAEELGITVWTSQKRIERMRKKIKEEFPDF